MRALALEATSGDRLGAYLVLAPAMTVIGALSGRLAGSAALAMGAAAGLGWTVLIGWCVARLARATSRRDAWATASLLTAGFVVTALFGGALFQMLLYAAASAPESILALMRPPLRGGFAFFVICNTLAEWLVIPLAVSMNWHVTRRRHLLVVGAVMYYAARVWTYLYFVPRIDEFMAAPEEGLLSTELTERILNWVQLSWIRVGIDGAVAVLLLLASSEPRREQEREALSS